MTLLRVVGCFLFAGASIGDPVVEHVEPQLSASPTHDAPADAGRDRLLRREVLQAKAAGSVSMRAAGEAYDTADAATDSGPPAASLLELGDLGQLVAEGTRRARRHKLFEKLAEVVDPDLGKKDDGAESMLQEFVKAVSKKEAPENQKQAGSQDGADAHSEEGKVAHKGNDDELQQRLASLVKDPSVREQVTELFEGHGEHQHPQADAHHEEHQVGGDDKAQGHHDDPHAEAKERVIDAVKRLLANAKDKKKAMQDVQRIMDLAKDAGQHDSVAELLETAEHEGEHREQHKKRLGERHRREQGREPSDEEGRREEDEHSEEHRGQSGHHRQSHGAKRHHQHHRHSEDDEHEGHERRHHEQRKHGREDGRGHNYASAEEADEQQDGGIDDRDQADAQDDQSEEQGQDQE